MRKVTPEQLKGFAVKEGKIGGETCYLITPENVFEGWTNDNLFLRSAICNSKWEIVSSGFPKFLNLGEKPEISPMDFSLGFDAYHKYDGSLLICSHYNGELITRTRGSFSTDAHDTGFEIGLLREKYKSFFNCPHVLLAMQEGHSFLFEWCGSHRIVIKEFNEPELVFLGAIEHETGKLWTQEFCDHYAQRYGLKRPQRFSYQNIQECIDDVILWQDKEGVVTYSKNGQTLKKIKAKKYLALHAILSGLSSPKNIYSLWESYGFLPQKEFLDAIEKNYDFEGRQIVEEKGQKMFDDIFEFNKKAAEVLEFHRQSLLILSRKEAALLIQEKYLDYRRNIGYSLLSGKTNDIIKHRKSYILND